MRALDDTRPDAIALDLTLPPAPEELLGLRIVERLAREGRSDRTLVLTGPGKRAEQRALAAGAGIVRQKPVSAEELREVARHLGIQVVAEPHEDDAPSLLLGSSAAMLELRRTIRAARGDGPVLITGETGSGKELVAQDLHRLHRRGAFQAVNCGALGSLADSQLFGHGPGAFTGAARKLRGAIEQAGDGTLFLDEIGELPIEQQPKLLRVLEQQPFQPLGEERWVLPRARVLAATNADLEAAVRDRRFRGDLLYRLAVHVIRVPPLRERLEDLPALTAALLARLPWKKSIAPPALALMMARSWPGNVRELRAFLERVAAQAEGEVIEVDEVLRADRNGQASGVSKAAVASRSEGSSFATLMSAQAMVYVERALENARGNVSAAARALGMHRMALVRLLERHGRR